MTNKEILSLIRKGRKMVGNRRAKVYVYKATRWYADIMDAPLTTYAVVWDNQCMQIGDGKTFKELYASIDEYAPRIKQWQKDQRQKAKEDKCRT